ncbi:MAG TPA: hypothetical protein VMW50_02525 [Dehalococcoidia bacterium]|jgi:hypothetical protein|nr:hypothetical protein [Dehalococcoidia bacterium]
MPQIENVFIERLKRKQLECLQFLSTPKDKTAFGYGEASGILQGLNRAEQLFNEVIGEEDDRT